MAMPITVTGLLANAASIETSSGPLVYNDAVYVFGRGTTGNLVRAFKCSDADTGSFSNVGTDITTNEDITACKACQQGDEIFVVTIDGDAVTTNQLRLHIFNTTSDTWTTTNEAVDLNFTTLSLASAKYLSCAIRSDGDLIVLYNGAVRNISAANRETVRYARREAGSWTAGVEVSNGGAANWYAGGVVLGSSDRMHFFLVNDTAADGFQRTLTSANALETFPAAYDASVSATEASLCGTGCSYDSAGTQKVRYPSRDTGNVICLGLKMDSADAPTISIDADITGALNMDSGAFRSSMAALGTTLYHVFVDSVDDIYYQTNANDAGWSGNTLFLTAACAGILTTIYIREGNYRLAMVYNNSTTPVYNELDLGPADTTITGTRNVTAAAATKTATGKVSDAGARNVTGAAATKTATGKVAIRGTRTATAADATKTASGTVSGPFTTGTRNVTAAAATKTATGAVAVKGTRSATGAAATKAATGTVRITGTRNVTTADATKVATGTISDLPIIIGTRNVTTADATKVATGTVSDAPPVPAPILPTDSSGGSGASNQRLKRKKFVIPDLENEPVKTLDDMLGIPREGTKPVVRELPPTPVKALPIGSAVAAGLPNLQYTSSLPLSSPDVDEEEYSDEDLIHLLMLVD